MPLSPQARLKGWPTWARISQAGRLFCDVVVSTRLITNRRPDFRSKPFPDPLACDRSARRLSRTPAIPCSGHAILFDTNY